MTWSDSGGEGYKATIASGAEPECSDRGFLFCTDLKIKRGQIEAEREKRRPVASYAEAEWLNREISW